MLLLSVVAFVPLPVIAQSNNAAALVADTSNVQDEIKKTEEEGQQYTGGLVKSLISLRLATLKQTLCSSGPAHKGEGGADHPSVHD